MENPQDWQKYLDSFFGEQFWSQFQGSFKENYPPVNLYKTENELICLFSIPGLSKLHEIEIITNYRELEVRGKVHYDFPGFHLYQKELYQGYFERTIQLPYPIRDDKVKASYDNGLLVIQLHRRIAEAGERKQIKLNEGLAP